MHVPINLYMLQSAFVNDAMRAFAEDTRYLSGEQSHRSHGQRDQTIAPSNTPLLFKRKRNIQEQGSITKRHRKRLFDSPPRGAWSPTLQWSPANIVHPPPVQPVTPEVGPSVPIANIRRPYRGLICRRSGCYFLQNGKRRAHRTYTYIITITLT